MLGDLPRWGSPLKIPGSASMLIELRMAEHGYKTAGLSVHVPHYLSQAKYPAASATLIESLSTVTGLDLPVGALENAASTVRTRIDAEVSGNAEVEAVVSALETQYDAVTGRAEQAPSLLASDESLPSGDELGAEVEKFLAQAAAGETDTDAPDESSGGDTPPGDTPPGDDRP
jgi:hypothetical protein